jgi:hypothetical protein
MKERRDKIYYDTMVIEPGQDVRMFGNRNIGNFHLCNLQIAGQLAPYGSFAMLAIGTRCVGKTREEEDLLLDHLCIEVMIGDRPYVDLYGPYASMLRHLFTREEMERYVQIYDDAKLFCAHSMDEHDFQTVKREGEKIRRCTRCEFIDDGTPFELPPIRIGYHLLRPLIVPERQNFYVRAEASPDLPETVKLRVHLFGLSTRETI